MTPTSAEQVVQSTLRRDKLKSILWALHHADMEDNDMFHLLLLETMEQVPLTNKDVAHLFGMSFPGVQRWLEGRTAPFPDMRRNVYRGLEREVIKVLGVFEQPGDPKPHQLLAHEWIRVHLTELEGHRDEFWAVDPCKGLVAHHADPGVVTRATAALPAAEQARVHTTLGVCWV